MAQHYLFNSQIRDYLSNDLKSYIRKLERVKDTDKMVEIGYAVAEAIDPYVPFKTGRLADYRITSKGNILYDTKYAQAQYYGDDSKWQRTLVPHHRATSMWDIVAMNDADVLEQINKDVTEIIFRGK